MPIKKESKNYLDGDFEIEGVIVNTLYGKLNPSHKPPTATQLDNTMFAVITKCRQIGLTEEEIEYSIRLNLRTYNYADKTFPVEKWMKQTLSSSSG